MEASSRAVRSPHTAHSSRTVSFIALGVVALALLVCAVLPRVATAYTPGDEIWRKALDGGKAGDDEGHDIVFGPRGSFYVVGLLARSSPTNKDIAVVRYTAGGSRKWTRSYDGPFHKDDYVAQAVSDAVGNVYVTGFIVRSGYKIDAVVLKYSPAGKCLWVRTYDGPKHGTDVGQRLALDGAGNVYVAVQSQSDPADPVGSDLRLLKYDRGGHRQWLRSWDPGTGRMVDFNGLVVDKKRGRVYVGGWVDTAGAGQQWVLTRYSTAGKWAWRSLWGGVNEDVSYALALAPDGTVYQAGSTGGGPALSPDAALIRWTATGHAAAGWPRLYDGPASQRDVFYSVAVNRLGNAFVAGTTYSAVTIDDAILRGYDPAGNTLWSYTYLHAGAQSVSHVACDAAGNTYAGGYSNEGAANPAYLVIKLAVGGGTSWTRTAKESTISLTGTDTLYAVAYRPGTYGGVYVTGRGAGDTTKADMFTIRFEP